MNDVLPLAETLRNVLMNSWGDICEPWVSMYSKVAYLGAWSTLTGQQKSLQARPQEP